MYTRPSIRVQLSLLDDEITIPKPEQRPKQIINRYVSVGKLMILGIGDIWSDRFLVSRNQRERVTFDDVNIGPATARIVKAGVSMDSGAHLLPFDEHPWHRAHTHSYCVEVPLANGQHLIIPCTVLLKFYFGSSSPLLSKLFEPNLKRPQLGALWRKPHGQAMRTHLAPGISGWSAEDITRILASPDAWNAASMIGRSCLDASSRSQPAYPKTTFPFQGSTSLVVQGLWLYRGEKKSRAFVVHEIHSCSAKFPFSSLSYRMHTQQREPRQPTEAGAKQGASRDIPKSKRIQTSPNKPTAPKLHERDAAHNLEPSVAFIKERRKFPDLENKRVTHFRSSPTASPRISQASTTNNAFSLADQGSGAPIRALQLVEARRKSYFTPPPAEVIPYIRELARHEHITSETITTDDTDSWTVPMPRPKPRMKKFERSCVLAIDSRHQFATIVIPITSPTQPLFYGDLKLESEDDLADLLARVPNDLKQQLRVAMKVPTPSSSSQIQTAPDQPEGVELLQRALQLFFR